MKSYRLFLLLLLISSMLMSQEICNNGIDDDSDGFIDLNDIDDCPCDIIEPSSLIPNPSFEEQVCCPQNRSQLDCATGWIQASEPTTDYIHGCSFRGWDQFPPPEPFPDGEGIMGFRDGRFRNNSLEPQWKEYAGACLLSPLKVGFTYKFRFQLGFVNTILSPPIDITFFGTNDCINLPFGINNDEFGCPANDPSWIELTSQYINGGSDGSNGGWVTVDLDFTVSREINAIAIGPSCEPTIVDRSIYYFFDNLVLSDINAFDLRISELSHPCSSDYQLSVADNPDFEYQWFKEGVALVGEVEAELSKLYGEGNYQTQIFDGTTCRLSTIFNYQKPSSTVFDNRPICYEDSLKFGDNFLKDEGVYEETFLDINGCDSLVLLTLNVIGQSFDTISASLYQGQSITIGQHSISKEGDHELLLESSLGCDSLVYLQLDYFDVFIPNVFGPELTSPDNVFKPYSATGNIVDVEMEIYDRWGNRIFTGQEWTGDGVEIGVYVYLITLKFLEGEPELFHGDVTLIR